METTRPAITEIPLEQMGTFSKVEVIQIDEKPDWHCCVCNTLEPNMYFSIARYDDCFCADHREGNMLGFSTTPEYSFDDKGKLVK